MPPLRTFTRTLPGPALLPPPFSHDRVIVPGLLKRESGFPTSTGRSVSSRSGYRTTLVCPQISGS